MTTPVLALVSPETPDRPTAEPSKDQPTEAEKVVLKAYAASLLARGFCKLTTTVRETLLYNRFDCMTFSLASFIEEDFDNWLHVHRKQCGFRSTKYIARRLTHIVGTKFMPSAGPYYMSPNSGITWVNTYRRYVPAVTDASVSELLLEFWQRMWPDPDDRRVCLQWLSHIYQHPDQRPSWHLMLPSVAGMGKGFLLQEILHPTLHHTSVIHSFSKLTGQFSTRIEDDLLIMLDDCKAKSEATTTALKSLLSEERAYVERKQQQGRMVAVYARMILASNEAKPLHLDEDERRWYVCSRLTHQESPAETQAFIAKLYAWLQEAGSLDRVYNWFMAYPLDGFNSKHVAQTKALKAIIGLSQNAHEGFIRDYIEDHRVFSTVELQEAVVVK